MQYFLTVFGAVICVLILVRGLSEYSRERAAQKLRTLMSELIDVRRQIDQLGVAAPVAVRQHVEIAAGLRDDAVASCQQGHWGQALRLADAALVELELARNIIEGKSQQPRSGAQDEGHQQR